jgi:hypothetical protein
VAVKGRARRRRRHRLELAVGTIATVREATTVERANRWRYGLRQGLSELGVTRIYSDYWTCDTLMFDTKERILCAVLDEDLTSGLNRYPPYQRAVEDDPGAVLVFPRDSRQAKTLAQDQRSQRIASIDPSVVFRMDRPFARQTRGGSRSGPG